MTDLDSRLVALVCDRLRTEIAPLFADLHRFVDRRIAELSAEVHGTAQLLGFSETNLSGQLSRIQEQIGRVVAVPVQATRSSGLDLEAVVQATETAANQIMEAAEVIGGWVRSDRRDPADLEVVAEKVNAIFAACSFQDLTGQRIRRAIAHLQWVEAMLSDLMPANMIQTGPPGAEQAAASAAAIDPDLAQGDVDRMFE